MATRDGEPRWESEPNLQRVAVLDAGAQYGMDIVQLSKRLGFYAERLPFETPLEELRSYGAIILSGGPESVYDPNAPMCDLRLFAPGQHRPPVLGICYGAQLINHMRGGTVERLHSREDGFTDVLTTPGSNVFADLPRAQVVMMSHGDSITEVAPGFRVTAHSAGNIIAAIENDTEGLYGLQFHPEVSTPEGPEMMRNFIQKIAGLEAGYEYSDAEAIEDATLEVREKVGSRDVLAFISGGVDSACLAAFLKNALHEKQLHLVHIDNGFMREGESERVVKLLASADIHVKLVDASEMFLNGRTTIDGVLTPPINEVIDPEIKRKIIGDVFVDVQDMVGTKLDLGTDFMLAMGTLHTDLIESGSKHASDKAGVIKSHHNDTDAVRRLREEGRVIEPWRYLQKDQVRTVGRYLGLPPEITERQPFPGPGLAIRVICAERPACNGNPEEIVAALAKFNSDDIKTALLGIQTVGVQGDHRTYGNLATLSGEADWPTLLQLARYIPRVVRSINRVVYVFGEPVEGFIDSITPTHLTPDVIDEIRHTDQRVNQILAKYGLDRAISQVPVVSFPINFGKTGKRSIGIRTIMTDTFKTGDIALPGVDFPEEVLLEIVDRVTRIPGISRVVYDLTSKPPGTTEWE